LPEIQQVNFNFLLFLLQKKGMSFKKVKKSLVR